MVVPVIYKFQARLSKFFSQIRKVIYGYKDLRSEKIGVSCIYREIPDF